MRQMHGGVRIAMPIRKLHRTSARHNTEGSSTRRGAGQASVPEAVHPQESIASVRGRDLDAHRASAPGAPAERPHVVLPPSTGVLVEDAEFPWPEKNADAAAGWLDN